MKLSAVYFGLDPSLHHQSLGKLYAQEVGVDQMVLNLMQLLANSSVFKTDSKFTNQASLDVILKIFQEKDQAALWSIYGQIAAKTRILPLLVP